MGKASKWFRSIFGSKKPKSWNRPSLNEEEGVAESKFVEEFDANKHAIAVAVATAAVAEAAVAAARAAAEVVRLTTAAPTTRNAHFSAIKIQSSFRAYLARRALKALRGLVKLQALVRGRIVRKRSADMLQRMQAMARIQARARATRADTSDSSHSKKHEASKGYGLQQHPATFQNGGQTMKHMQKYGSRSNVINPNVGERTYLPSNWLDRWMEECTWINHQSASSKHKCGDDENSDKILEIDTWKPHQNPRRMGKPFRSSQYFSAWNDSAQGGGPLETDSTNSARCQNPNPSFSSEEVSSIKSLKVPPEADKLPLWTAENSPHVHSASSRPGSSKRRNVFSPVRSEGGRSFYEGGRSFYGDYPGYPNYMANTESYKAKVRSQSAPRQRSQINNFTTSRQVVHCPWDSDTRSEKDSTLHFRYQNGYSGSAQIGKKGSPVRANSGSIHSR